ncbi:MAG: acyl carrier protein [Propionibacteriaceae bacterium]|jgi:acyl carrier protein|nr:acyl carrier protein [Propionibacteriaceae bacterium]
MTDVNAVVIEVIREHHHLPDAAITADTDLADDLGLNSFEIVELCSMIEERLNVRIDLDHLSKATTVGDLERYFTNVVETGTSAVMTTRVPLGKSLKDRLRRRIFGHSS